MEENAELLFDGETGDADAERCFILTQHNDPFPEIVPALLNSADIEAYARETGMVSPFNLGEGKLKSASYEIDLKGVMHLWKPDSCERKEVILHEKGQEFILEPNSIVYFFTETKFRLPDYIALRFNLRITHVHRGLLLGTGPLIDPGYQGKLLIPLHNLTNNPYKLIVGEGLIWVEFTKLSPHRDWDKSVTQKHQFKYRPFPEGKKDLPAHYFLEKAFKGPIISSIHKVITDAETKSVVSADNATKAAKDAEIAQVRVNEIYTKFRNISFWGGIAVVASLASIVIATLTLVNNYITSARDQLKKSEEKLEFLTQKQAELTYSNSNLQSEISILKVKINKIIFPAKEKCTSANAPQSNPKAPDTKKCPENVH